MPSQQRVQLLLRVKTAYLGNERGLGWHLIQAKLERGMKAEHCDRHQSHLVGAQEGSQAELLRHKERSKECSRQLVEEPRSCQPHFMSSGFTVLLRSLNQSIQQLMLFNLPFPDIPIHL